MPSKRKSKKRSPIPKRNHDKSSKTSSSLEADVVRTDVVKTGKRIDGRDTAVRQIVAKSASCRKTHGSALFTRGETQAIVVATLGTGQDEQIIDALEGEYKETSCCITTSRPTRSAKPAAWAPGRREIGHGKLAWRAIHPLLADERKISPTPSAWCRKSPNPTARPRWPPSAAARWR
jgi:polyribonucleotide nucleotidyltransferase